NTFARGAPPLRAVVTGRTTPQGGSMAVDVWDAMLNILQPTNQWATPGALAQHLDPRTRQTPALDLIDNELARLADTPDGRLIVSMPPQEGKSQRCSRR